MAEKPQADQELEALDRAELERWRAGETLTTLQLRGACHAAQREKAGEDERALSVEIAEREALGR